jgi:peptide/nickel transport system ATP-binding protein
LLSVRDLSVVFPGGLGKPSHQTVHEVSFDIAAGESFGLVGESGSGKTAISPVVTGLQQPTSGSVRFEQEEISPRHRRALSRRIQLVFQDPYGSLKPDRTIGDSIGAPLTVSLPAHPHSDSPNYGRRSRASSRRWAWTPASPAPTPSSFPAECASGPGSPARCRSNRRC